MLGEAVQVQAVIPVSTADQRKVMRAEMIDGEIKRPLEVLHQCCGNGHIVVVRNDLIQNGIITCLSCISADGSNEPQRIIVETGADSRIALLGKRLVLMISRAVLELCGSNVNDSLPCTFRNQVYKAEKILTGITEAHAAADSGFIVGSRTAHVEGDHALVLIPDIYHTVYLVISGMNRIVCQKILPVILQLCVRAIHIGVRLVAIQKRPCSRLVNDLISGSRSLSPLLVLRILDVCENKNKGSGFTGSQCQIQLMRSNRRPSACHRIVTFSLKNRLRLIRAIVEAHKFAADRVKAIDLRVDGVYRVVIAALAILCLMENCRIHQFNLTGRKVSLEVLAVIRRIPEAPFHIREELNLFCFVCVVGKLDLLNLTGIIQRNKAQKI